MKLIVKDLKFQETSEILLKHFPEAPGEELVIYPEYTEKSGLKVLKYGNNVKIQYHQDVQYYHTRAGLERCLIVPETGCLKPRQ